MVLTFGERTACNIEEPGEIRVRPPTEPFGDVARRRRCGIPYLIAEPEIPLHVRLFRQPIDSELQFVRKLPARELPEMSCAGHPPTWCNSRALKKSTQMTP